MKKILIVLTAVLLIMLSACGSEENKSSGPYAFHGVTVTIPDGYIVDASRSDDNTQWFDSAWTKEQILIYRAEPPVEGTIGDESVNEDYGKLIQSYDEVSDFSSKESSVDDIPALDCRYIQEEQHVLASYFSKGDYIYGIMMFNKYEYSTEAYEEMISSVTVEK